jgi:hypothetical protein
MCVFCLFACASAFLQCLVDEDKLTTRTPRLWSDLQANLEVLAPEWKKVFNVPMRLPFEWLRGSLTIRFNDLFKEKEAQSREGCLGCLMGPCNECLSYLSVFVFACPEALHKDLPALLSYLDLPAAPIDATDEVQGTFSDFKVCGQKGMDPSAIASLQAGFVHTVLLKAFGTNDCGARLLVGISDSGIVILDPELKACVEELLTMLLPAEAANERTNEQTNQTNQPTKHTSNSEASTATLGILLDSIEAKTAKCIKMASTFYFKKLHAGAVAHHAVAKADDIIADSGVVAQAASNLKSAGSCIERANETMQAGLQLPISEEVLAQLQQYGLHMEQLHGSFAKLPLSADSCHAGLRAKAGVHSCFCLRECFELLGRWDLRRVTLMIPGLASSRALGRSGSRTCT